MKNNFFLCLMFSGRECLYLGLFFAFLAVFPAVNKKLVKEAAGLDAQALQYLSAERYTEARPLFVRALRIRERELGREHSDTAVSMNNLAVLYGKMGRYEDAENLRLDADLVVLSASQTGLESLAEKSARPVPPVPATPVAEFKATQSGAVLQLFALEKPEQSAAKSAETQAAQSAQPSDSTKNTQSKGISGLARAFFYAGTPGLVLSLWSISDAGSGEFMRLFYKELKSGADTAEALQKTRRQMLSGIYAHPFYWAPFILVGDPLAHRKRLSAE